MLDKVKAALSGKGKWVAAAVVGALAAAKFLGVEVPEWAVDLVNTVVSALAF